MQISHRVRSRACRTRRDANCASTSLLRCSSTRPKDVPIEMTALGLTLTRFSIRIIEYCAYSSLRRPTCLIIASRFSRSLSMRTSIAATHLRVRV